MLFIGGAVNYDFQKQLSSLDEETVSWMINIGRDANKEAVQLEKWVDAHRPIATPTILYQY